MSLEAEFREFHKKNPHVYRMFKAYTMQAIGKGRKHFSARMIFERIRWYTAIETENCDFKINDHNAPYYARMFMEEHPEYAGFFRTRKLRTEKVEA